VFKSPLLQLPLAAFLLVSPAAVRADECGGTFPAIADASTLQAAPAENFGSESELRVVDPGDGTQAWRSYLRFDLGSALPPGAIVDEAFLRLRAIGADGELPWEIRVHGADKGFNESTLTWNKQPPATAPYSLHGASVVDDLVVVDVTELATHWARGERGDPTIVLTSGRVGGVGFLSREGAAPDDAPELTIVCHLPSPLDPPDPADDDAAQAQALDRLRADSLEPVRVRLSRGAVASAEFRVVVPAGERRDPLARSRWFLREYAGLLRAGDADSAWQPLRRSPDGRHLRFRQRHAGIPVWRAETIVHLDGDDVTGLSGAYATDLPAMPAPVIPLERAVALAQVAAGEGAARGGDVRPTIFDPRLAGYSDGGGARLAWEVPVEGPRGGIYLIDALDGATLHVETAIQEAFNLSLNTAGFEDGPNFIGCWFWNGGDVEWFNEFGQSRFTPPTPDAEGFAAFGHISAIDAYWRRTHGRDGHADNGGEEGLYLDTIIRDAAGNPSSNALFHPFCNDFRFTDNNGTRDIIGHEFTHGVVQSEAALAYVNQSGALNESYADLFGFAVDPGNWTIGEGSALGTARDLSNPPRFSQPDHMLPAVSGDMTGLRPTPAGSPDNGFVHTNSGIPNKAGYLLIAGGSHGGYTITALGRTVTERLLYDTLTNRLGGWSGLLDQRDQMVAAAAADPALSPFQRCQVRNAYAAVGLGAGDADCNGIGDTLEVDDDADGVLDAADNCPQSANGSQADLDGDGAGDACDPDIDDDGLTNVADNCPRAANPIQQDWNGDGIGDRCQDWDGDGVLDSADNCPSVPNADQRNSDYDLLGGDACDADDDGDGVLDGSDNCPLRSNWTQADFDQDGRGDQCDNCREASNFDQLDGDRDGRGDTCDDDWDNDGVRNASDNCPRDANPTQADWDGDGRGNDCDPLETQMIYEDPTFFRFERYAQWPLNRDFPLEIGVPVCPRCTGEALTEGFVAELRVRMSAPFAALVRDSSGYAVDVVREPRYEQVLRFEPEAGAFSQFSPWPEAASVASDPGYLAPDQTRYVLELYPADPADTGVDQAVQIEHVQCIDSDGDGFGVEGSAGCPAGDQIDCADEDWSSSPAGAERCDGLDNDCDAVVDDEPWPPARTARLFAHAGGEIRWTDLVDTWSYDLVRGSLRELRAANGDFAGAAAVCLVSRTDERSFVDTEVPEPGDAFFYLVRGANCAGAGSWDQDGASQRGSRDPGLTACGQAGP